MRLRYTVPALAELDEVLRYISARTPDGASSVQLRLRSIIDLIARHPRVGLQTSDPAIRRIAATPYPCLVFYEVTADEIIIHAVRHGARSPSSMPGAQ